MARLVKVESVGDLGDAVRSIRKSRGIPQNDVAAMIAVNRTTLIDIERGKGDPRLSTIVKLAEACGLMLALVPRDVLLHRSATLPPKTAEIDFDDDGLDIELAWKGDMA